MNLEIYNSELSLIYLNYDHRHIIISRVVKYLYNKKLTNEAQQIRNKISYNYVNIMQGNASKYKIELALATLCIARAVSQFFYSSFTSSTPSS